MKKILFTVFALLGVLVAVGLGNADAALNWRIEDIDAPKVFSTARTAVAVDDAGYAHIAYGGDRLYYAYENASGWHIQTADTAPQVGTHLSMALDADGHAHISYFDERNEDLKYATNASGVWTAVTLDSDGRVGEYTAIAIDAGGVVHISYYYNDLPTLRYATNAGGSWSTEDVHKSSPSTSGNVGWFSDIAVDVAGVVHISYTWQEKGKLGYANNAFGGFFARQIADLWPASEFFSGQPVQTSIAVDPSQHVHIIYGYSAATPSNSVILKHANDQNVEDIFNDEWDIETVDSLVSDVGWYNDLAVDSAGNLHVSYTTGNTENSEDDWNLRYATNAGGTWARTTVDNGNPGATLSGGTEVGLYSAIAVDGSDAVHISYVNTTHYPYAGCDGTGTYPCREIDLLDRLWHAENTGSGWTYAEVDKTGRVGDTPALALDPTSGKVHIIYHEELVDTLKYAAGSFGNWAVETAGDTGYAGTPEGDRSGAIGVDSDGTVHIAFSNLETYDDENGVIAGSALIYNYRPKMDGWQVSQVLAYRDPIGMPHDGYVPSLAVDSTDVIHVSFSSGTGIYYANSAENWALASVTQGESVGDYSAIDVDSQNRPHLLYVTSTGGLKYRFLDAGGWSAAEDVDSNLGVNRRMNIVVDAADRVHATYNTGDGHTHATNGSGSWVTQTLAGGTGGLAVDGGGHLHICYGSGNDLYYMTNASGDFLQELVDTGVSTGSRCAIGAGDSGRIHIAYYNNAMYDLKYATAVSGFPDIVVTPDAHDFGAVGLSTTASQVFTLKNFGDEQLQVTDVYLNGQGPVEYYTLDLNGGGQPCGSSSFPLVPAGSCTVAVEFTPTEIGPHYAVLNVASNDPDEPAKTATLAGTALDPNVDLADLILVLKVLVDVPVSGADTAQRIDGDPLGLSEAIYILQTLAGIQR